MTNLPICGFIETPSFILNLPTCLEVLLEQISSVAKDQGETFKS